MEQQKHQSTLKVFGLVLTTCCGAFFFGYQMGQLNLALNTLDYLYKIDDDQQGIYNGLMTSAAPFGAAFGAIFTAYFLTKVSRRQLMMMADIVGGAACFLCVIQNAWMLIISRLITGVVIGINSAIVPIFIKEISPTALSGRTGSMNQGFINLGIIVSQLFGLGFPYQDYDDIIKQHITVGSFYWRFVLIFGVIPCVLRFLLFFFIYKDDSPLYYLLQQDEQTANRVITNMYYPEYAQEVLDAVKKEAEAETMKKESWGDMFKVKYYKRTEIGIVMQIIQQLSGINAVVFYSGTIFSLALGGDAQNARYMVIAMGCFQTLSSFCAGPFTKAFGRKFLFLYGTSVLVVFLIVLGIISDISGSNPSNGESAVIIVFIFAYMFVFQTSLGPIVWLYNAEILPVKGVSIATLTNWTFCFAVGLLFPVLVDAWLIWRMFFIFCGFMVIGFYYVLFYIKETKGLNQNQIEDIFTRSIHKPLIQTKDTNQGTDY